MSPESRNILQIAFVKKNAEFKNIYQDRSLGNWIFAKFFPQEIYDQTDGSSQALCRRRTTKDVLAIRDVHLIIMLFNDLFLTSTYSIQTHAQDIYDKVMSWHPKITEEFSDEEREEMRARAANIAANLFEPELKVLIRYLLNSENPAEVQRVFLKLIHHAPGGFVDAIACESCRKASLIRNPILRSPVETNLSLSANAELQARKISSDIRFTTASPAGMYTQADFDIENAAFQKQVCAGLLDPEIHDSFFSNTVYDQADQTRLAVCYFRWSEKTSSEIAIRRTHYAIMLLNWFLLDPKCPVNLNARFVHDKIVQLLPKPIEWISDDIRNEMRRRVINVASSWYMSPVMDLVEYLINSKQGNDLKISITEENKEYLKRAITHPIQRDVEKVLDELFNETSRENFIDAIACEMCRMETSRGLINSLSIETMPKLSVTASHYSPFTSFMQPKPLAEAPVYIQKDVDWKRKEIPRVAERCDLDQKIPLFSNPMYSTLFSFWFSKAKPSDPIYPTFRIVSAPKKYLRMTFVEKNAEFRNIYQERPLGDWIFDKLFPPEVYEHADKIEEGKCSYCYQPEEKHNPAIGMTHLAIFVYNRLFYDQKNTTEIDVEAIQEKISTLLSKPDETIPEQTRRELRTRAKNVALSLFNREIVLIARNLMGPTHVKNFGISASEAAQDSAKRKLKDVAWVVLRESIREITNDTPGNLVDAVGCEMYRMSLSLPTFAQIFAESPKLPSDAQGAVCHKSCNKAKILLSIPTLSTSQKMLLDAFTQRNEEFRKVVQPEPIEARIFERFFSPEVYEQADSSPSGNCLYRYQSGETPDLAIGFTHLAILVYNRLFYGNYSLTDDVAKIVREKALTMLPKPDEKVPDGVRKEMRTRAINVLLTFFPKETMVLSRSLIGPTDIQNLKIPTVEAVRDPIKGKLKHAALMVLRKALITLAKNGPDSFVDAVACEMYRISLLCQSRHKHFSSSNNQTQSLQLR